MKTRNSLVKTHESLIILFMILFGVSWSSAQDSSTQDQKGASQSLQAVTNDESEKTKTIVFIGDSLTAGYGVRKDQAYPARVEDLLRKKGHAVKVINGGISGSVTAEANRRVKWYSKAKPDIVVIALGANDALKGTPVDVIKKNLSEAIDAAKSENSKVLLAGMNIFSNFGDEYGKSFAKLYRDLAQEKKVSFMPFLLEGVALEPKLNLQDGKHPNEKGHEVIAKNVGLELEKLL